MELLISPKTADRPAAAIPAANTFVARPVIAPLGGAYVTSVEVSLRCATSGATIYYTTDGSIPSPTNGTEYTAPFTLEP